MDPDELPDVEDLWWSWVVLAALHRAAGDDTCRFQALEHLLTLDTPDGSWLRMQRTHGSRAVLWGRSARAPQSPPDARRGAPDWALSEATRERRPTFLAWHVHGEWDLSAPSEDDDALHLLRPLLTVDPRIVELSRAGRLTTGELAAFTEGEHIEEAAELTRQGARPAPRTSRGSVRSRLRDQIHDQMRDTEDVDRELMQRPPLLVQWVRASGAGISLEYAVMSVRDRLVPSPLGPVLPDPVTRSLGNVLRTLHREETGEESGGWLFARVRSDGVVVRLDRAFDSWPAWYQVASAEDGPDLEDLAWEMSQRSPEWRPAWASLLPEH